MAVMVTLLMYHICLIFTVIDPPMRGGLQRQGSNKAYIIHIVSGRQYEYVSQNGLFALLILPSAGNNLREFPSTLNLNTYVVWPHRPACQKEREKRLALHKHIPQTYGVLDSSEAGVTNVANVSDLRQIQDFYL